MCVKTRKDGVSGGQITFGEHAIRVVACCSGLTSFSILVKVTIIGHRHQRTIVAHNDKLLINQQFNAARLALNVDFCLR